MKQFDQPNNPYQLRELPLAAAAVFSGNLAAEVLTMVPLALAEDGLDLTSLAIFDPKTQAEGRLTCKQDSIVAGLPLISVVLAALGKQDPQSLIRLRRDEGERLLPGEIAATIRTDALTLLKAERVILNFISHLSGIATLTRSYVDALLGTGVKLLDTRKTVPGLRYLEKYAVRVGGGCNHRLNLEEMLMIKDNHIDSAGSILNAVTRTRDYCNPCPPIVIECRNLEEVTEAIMAHPERIMLDNMSPEQLAEILPLIPRHIETEISGGITLENIRSYALCCTARRADYISVGRITHSAPASDYSLYIQAID